MKNADLKLLAFTGPEMGFLTIFIGLLWPDTETDPWDRVRERTEKLIDQKIAEEVYKRVRLTITGLGGEVKLHNNALNENIDPSDKRDQLRTTNNQFVYDIPQFQESAYERILLPLFMQAANMHLVLIHHALKIDPKVLDFKTDDRAAYTKQLDTSVDKYTIYARQILAQGPPVEGADPTTA